MKPTSNKDKKVLLNILVTMINATRKRVAVTVNQELTLLYWNIGKTIRTEILNNKRADYGKSIIDDLSIELTNIFGKGFSKRNLHNFIKFCDLFQDKEIVQTLSAQLTWSHITILLHIDNSIKREFYIQLCKHELWSVRTLQERIDSMLFERTAISKKPEKTIIKELESLKNSKKMSPDLVFRDPYILDFLDLKDTFSEKDLENSILARLQYFLTELGSDFAFIARQKRIVIDDEDFYIDLLFYHRSLRCLVVIDLKLGKFKASYKSQMKLYLKWLEKYEQKKGENKPIGLILCSEKSPQQIQYLLLDKDKHIKIAEFTTQLPDKNLLKEKLNKAIELANYYLNDKNKPTN